MASQKNLGKMFSFLVPFLPAFCISIPLSFVIAGVESVSVWLLGTLPTVLLGKTIITPQIAPVFTFATLNEYLKYHTYQILSHTGTMTPLVAGCVLIVILYTLKNLVTYVNNIISINVFTGVIRNMRDKMFGHIMRMKVEYFDRTDSGSIMSLMLNDVEKLKSSITGTVQQIIVEPIKLIISMILLIAISWQLTLAIFTIYPILGYIIVAVGKSIKRKSTRELTSFSDSLSRLSETVSGIRIVKMFNAVAIETQRYHHLNNVYTSAARRNERMKMILSPFTETLAMYMAAGLILFGGTLATGKAGGFSTDDFVRFLIILVLSYKPIKSLAGVNTNIQTGFAAADRFFALIDNEEEPLNKQATPICFEKDLSFNNVWFKYPHTDKWVLRGVSFTVRKGEMLAIVGSSGAGKSTILDLIPRFYDYEKGSISIDGKELGSIPLLDLRQLLGVVTQDNFLFNGSVRENIAYGSKIDEARLTEAARAANALEFIEHLEGGMNASIGERGVTLSGGQRQRLAIARALYRNAPLIIFDEATSALDTESERLVQSAIDGISKSRTVIVVAHRLSTVKHADNIVVLENGSIIEFGKHEELVALNGRYKKLCDMQFV